jgi:hypothetical protein
VFICLDCFEHWKSTFVLANGKPCDDTHCRYCTGSECPECGSNDTRPVMSMAEVRRIKNLKERGNER